MSREYRNVKLYEKEILSLRAQGLSLKAIGEELGFSRKQIDNFFTRYNNKQRKLSAGIILRPKGRPRKNENNLPPSIQQSSKVIQLQYELAMKERQLKRLEMENELMRDFLSLTERK